MLLVYNMLMILCWIIFIGFLSLESVNVKRNRGEEEGWKSNRFALSTTLLFFVVIFTFLLRNPILMVSTAVDVVPVDSALSALGLVLCAFGIIVAIWARVHLGRNWSDEPALKEGHHLVKTGPYRLLRHPIYSGVLVASVGSALVGGAVWIAVLVVLILVFTYRMQKEERMLAEEFGEAFYAYKKRTPALIPFLF